MEVFFDALGVLLQVLAVFNIAFTVFIIFFEKKNPAVTWAWLMVIALVPYVGFVIYMVLGFDGRKHTVFYRKAREDEECLQGILEQNFVGLEHLSRQQEFCEQDIHELIEMNGIEHIADLLYLNYKSGGGMLTTNNHLTLYHEGNAKFERLFADIAAAKSHIHLQYYILRSDELGHRLIAALAEKAAEGIEVRLFTDGTGSMNRRKFYQPLLDAGGKVAIFEPPTFIRINYRNHRKIAVIDGLIGYIGGLNIGDEYLGKKKRFGYWRDTHIRLTGDAIKNLEIRLIMDWNYAVGNKSEDKIVPQDKYFPVCSQDGGGVPMQIVSSGPDTRWFNVYNGYAKMITEADKSIFIETPYFVPDDNILESLRIAALAGIDVRVIIPANPDHPFVYGASLSYLGDLMKAGVKCYQYKKGFIHSKVLIIDGIACSTGTANMDVRSFKLNFEINAFIFDRPTVAELERQFYEDLQHCEEITQEEYAKRGLVQRFKESFSRLLSPLL